MPYEEDFLRKAHKDLSFNILRRLEIMTKDFAETSQFLDLRNEMAERMEKDFEQKLELNDELSQNLCKRLINEFFNSFNIPAMVNLDDIRESLLLEHKEKFLLFYDNYKSFSKGSRKCNLLRS
jgi:hypothetical protein